MSYFPISDAVRRTISMKVGEREYKLNNQVATLMVRPRGWHLEEAHVLVNGRPGRQPIQNYASASV